MPGAGKADLFAATHWSVVLLASQSEAPGADAALARLCQTYWYPLYVFIRRSGYSPSDAQDLVQGFFARLLEKNYIKEANPDRGKFRAFLLTYFKRFVSNEWERANNQRHGGGWQLISLDTHEAETRYLSEPTDDLSPERALERRWALALLDQVLNQLEMEFSDSGKPQLFSELKVFLTDEVSDDSRTEICNRLGMTEGALRVTIHRLRQRYRALVRLEIANTVESPEAVEDELQRLFTALS